MKNKRNRPITGRFIKQKALPKANPTLKEITKGQKDYDIVQSNKDCSKSGDSPYWNWVKDHAPIDSIGERLELPEANPDILPEIVPANLTQFRPIHSVEHIYSLVLTPKQANIMHLLINGYTEKLIAKRYKISQQTVNTQIKAAKKKLEKYFLDHYVKSPYPAIE